MGWEQYKSATTQFMVQGDDGTNWTGRGAVEGMQGFGAGQVSLRRLGLDVLEPH